MSRELEIWKSSRAEEVSPISGAFVFHVVPTLMVPQTMEFLFEKWKANISKDMEGEKDLILPFIMGMSYFGSGQIDNFQRLYWWKTFDNSNELFSFDLENLSNAIYQLEIHTDINLTFNKISYLADVGTGPNLPLMQISRIAIPRGIGFEIEEKGEATQSICLGDFKLSNKAKLAQKFYSLGVALLAGEDQILGLIDGAFMQFYLVIETILRDHSLENAVANGTNWYKERFTDDLKRVTQHVFTARHRFFGHAHPKFFDKEYKPEIYFNILRQVLVARWCARSLIELEVKRPLVKREMRFYFGQKSYYFNGDVNSRSGEFALPE